jgi:hypothetical protein
VKIKHSFKTFSLFLVTALLFLNCNVGVNPDNALESYINNNDKSYEWEVYDNHDIEGAVLYNILLTSQK